MIARAFDGKPEGLTQDDVLDNVTFYWLTNTAISSARLYWDTGHNLPPGGFFDVRGIQIPVAVSGFAEEIYKAPKRRAEKAYPKLIFYNKRDRGTHSGELKNNSLDLHLDPLVWSYYCQSGQTSQ